MSGTRAGGAKAAATNKAKYGEGFYQSIGAKGGMKGTTGGFYASKNYPPDHPAHPSNAGRKGGALSKRGKKMVEKKILGIVKVRKYV